MILGENVSNVYSKGKEIQQVYSYGKLVWEKKTDTPDTPDVIDYSTIPFTIKAIYDNVKLQAEYYNGEAITLKYSINGGAEQTGETIYIRQDDELSIKMVFDEPIRFNIKGLCDVYGNIMSIQYGEDFVGKTEWKLIYQNIDFFGLFNSCNIRDAKNLILPSTTIKPYAYAWMFYDCKYLISTPELPATQLADSCYYQMFNGCSSLTTAPELPATVLSPFCYRLMFHGCSSLTTAPELPATTLKEYCYNQMFLICRKLNYIKCYATGIDNDSLYPQKLEYCLLNWTLGVSQTGTLVCYKSYANELKQYIPETWTVEYID